MGSKGKKAEKNKDSGNLSKTGEDLPLGESVAVGIVGVLIAPDKDEKAKADLLNSAKKRLKN